MNLVPVLLVLAAISNSSQPTDYRTAYTRSHQGDKPLLVLVTAQWCPPCQRMKQSTIPQMIDENRFSDFNFAMLDVNAEPNNARNLIGGGLIPQLIIYEKQGDKWMSRHVTGFKSIDEVEGFLAPSRRVRTAQSSSLGR